MTSDRDDILDGIEAELRDTPEYYEFVVHGSEKEADIWKVHVDLTNVHSNGLEAIPLGTFDGILKRHIEIDALLEEPF